jgi:hypothetical protein
MFVVVLIVAGAVIIPLWESPSETALAEAEKLEALARECGVGICASRVYSLSMYHRWRPAPLG